SLVEVIHAGQQLVGQVWRPRRVPDDGEVVLAAGHDLVILAEDRTGELRRLARAQEGAHRDVGLVADLGGNLDQAVVALAGIVAAGTGVQARRRGPAADGGPQILISRQHHRIDRDVVLLQHRLGRVDPGVRERRAGVRIGDYVFLTLVVDEEESAVF